MAIPDTPDLDEPEHERVEDAPLFRTEPDRRMQRHTLLLFGVIFSVTASCVIVVAITTRSAPTTLISAIPLLAVAVPIIVRHVFPK